jgi:hypothetical protein
MAMGSCGMAKGMDGGAAIAAVAVVADGGQA